MKRLMRLLTISLLLVGFLGWFGMPEQANAATLHISLPSLSVLAVEEAPTLLRRNRADDKLGTEFGKKIDLNNTNVRAFQKYPGLYPTLARKVIQNAPYKQVDDVLAIEGLSDHQKELLQANLDNFAVTESESAFTEGDDRYNNGIYR